MSSPSTATVQSIFRQYQQEIEVFLTRRLACADTAADLTQEVFMRVLNAPKDSIANIGNIRAYLYKVASNTAINYQVAERRQHLLWESSAEHIGQIDERTPERIAGHKESLQIMSAALRELSPLAQQVFILTRIKGMKQKEVASKLNIHITTVEKNLSKAVRHCYAAVLENQ